MSVNISLVSGQGKLAKSIDSQASLVDFFRARALGRAWAESISEHRRPDMAGLFVRHALLSFAEVARPGIKLSSPFHTPFGTLDSVGEQLARTIGRNAASLPLAEGLHFITGLYPALLPARMRSELGAFYTPPCLVQRLCDLATESGVNWSTARVLDPSVGAGAFLIAVADRMRAALVNLPPAAVLKRIGDQLTALDIDPVAAGLAQASFEILLHDLAKAARKPVPVVVRVCDTLDEQPEPHFDLVLGNPPYGRLVLTSEQRVRFARGLFGHANLYGIFTDLAIRWCKLGGRIAFLTPTSFLAGQYFSALRRLLGSEAPPIAIDFVNARRGVFDEVLQETVLTVFERGAQRQRAQVHYLKVQSETNAEVVRNGTIGLPHDCAFPWLAPRVPNHSDLIKRVERMTARVRDYGYTVSTGPLVWNRHKGQLRSNPGNESVLPLIWAECVTPEGNFVFRALKRNHAPFFKLESGDDWLRVQTPCVLVQRTTAKEQARRLIAAELPEAFIKCHGGVVIENHLNMIWPINDEAVAPKVLAALLNSRVVDQVFRCISGSVAVSAFELEHLPLPDVGALEALQSIVDVKNPDASKVDAEVARLYGWTTQ